MKFGLFTIICGVLGLLLGIREMNAKLATLACLDLWVGVGLILIAYCDRLPPLPRLPKPIRVRVRLPRL